MEVELDRTVEHVRNKFDVFNENVATIELPNQNRQILINTPKIIYQGNIVGNMLLNRRT